MIDEIDRQILLLLQEDAHLSNAALAERVGLTGSTVHERVRKLEKKGVIKGYVAVIDAEAVGKPIMAFIRLTISTTPDGYIKTKNSILDVCRAEPDVLECYGVAGEDCYILKVRATSPKDLDRLLGEIRSKATVSSSITNIVLSTFKESSTIVPLEQG